MRIVLADLASTDGFVSKDTVVGGYGSRLRPFSRVTSIICSVKRRLHDVPSVQLGYIAAICAAAGHEVTFTSGPAGRRRRRARAHVARRSPARGGVGRCAARAGCGSASSASPRRSCRSCSRRTAISSSSANRRAAAMRLAAGDGLERPRDQRADRGSRPPAVSALGSGRRRGAPRGWSPAVRRPSRRRRHSGAGQPRLSRSSAPIARTASWPSYRARSVGEHRRRARAICADLQPRPYVVFRDPLFTEDRDRCLALCDEIRRARPGAALRVRDAARSARSGAAAPHARAPACAR